jgi:hypothetical protein
MRRPAGALALLLAASCSRSAAKHDPPAADPVASAAPTPDPKPAPPSIDAAAAAPASPPSWEDAVATCAPGTPYDACVHALEGAGVKLRKVDRADYREVTFELQPPFGGVGVRTYPNAGGRIVNTMVAVFLDQGKPRKDLVTWMAAQVGASATQVRAGGARGAAANCGEEGWGVGWAGPSSSEPEVELELTSPESESANDQPDKRKPIDALVERQGNGLVGVCFVLPPQNGKDEPIAAPALSVAAMKAYLASPQFHGVARLK